MNWYIYAYYEPDCSVPFYIGKGIGDRYKIHLQPHKLKCIDPFHNKLRQLILDGYIPTVQKLEENLSEHEANHAEIRLIAYFGRRTNGGTLLNMTDGGEGMSGFRHSELSKAKVSLTMTLNPPPGNRTRRTEEWKENHRQKMIGNTHTKGKPKYDNRRKIVQKRFDRVIREYEYIKQVEEYGYNRTSVNYVLSGKRTKYRGYTWEYKV